MKKILFALITLAIGLSLFSCANIACTKGNGEILSKVVEMDGIKRIDVKGSGYVYLKQGDNENIEVKTDENIFEYVSVEINNDVLEIASHGVICPTELTYYIVVKDPDQVRLSGSSDMFIENSLNTERFEIIISGSSDILIDEINSTDLSFKISGSGDIKAAGSSNNTQISISGSGDVNIGELKTEKLDVNIRGSGDVKANVANELNTKISGSGDVRYYGDPKVETKISGSGDVFKINDER
jgi:hypothetical protein